MIITYEIMVLTDFFKRSDSHVGKLEKINQLYQYGKIFPYHYGSIKSFKTMFVMVQHLDFEEDMEFVQSA